MDRERGGHAGPGGRTSRGPHAALHRSRYRATTEARFWSGPSAKAPPASPTASPGGKMREDMVARRRALLGLLLGALLVAGCDVEQQAWTSDAAHREAPAAPAARSARLVAPSGASPLAVG